MSYENRWKKIEPPLGRGGQGTVYLVEDKQVTREPEVLEGLQSRVLRTMLNIHGLTQDAAPKAAKEMYDLFTSAVQGQIQPHLGALKILHEVPTHGDDKSTRERIKREISVLTDFKHPNVVKLLDSSDEGTWFVTEYFSHGTLTDNRERFRGELRASLKALRPIVEALAALNSNGQVHRDIKPDNIFCNLNGSLVLGDFGLIFSGNTPETRLTLTDENVGSWQWMPLWTEYIRVEDVRPSFDVFSVGKVLWSMLAGRDKLHLWWYSRDSNNVEKLFPEVPEMKIANELFSKCIVENEEDCLPNCGVLLSEIDQSIAYLEGKGGYLSLDLPRRCLVCGEGHYTELAGRNVTQLHNLGLQPTGVQTYKVHSCDRCGHVQLFYSKDEGDPPAWRNRP